MTKINNDIKLKSVKLRNDRYKYREIAEILKTENNISVTQKSVRAMFLRYNTVFKK